MGALQGFRSFSPNQRRVLTWWRPGSPDAARDALICDGAVRSGKTICMSLSFVAWAFAAFDGASLAFCGKTIQALRRNIVTPVLPMLLALGFACKERPAQNLLELRAGGRRNRFYLFGGRDEGAAAHIQGITLGGVMIDEAALLPRPFVEQALARCSLEGSKFWFNCNPEHPLHWFHTEWIQKAEEKNALHLHFTMDDNPSLGPAMKARYKALYSGAFYQRFVEGKWVQAQGLVYPTFNPRLHVAPPPAKTPDARVVSCDYGTVNPTSFGLWEKHGHCWYRVREYYYDARATGAPRTDEEHYQAMEALVGAGPLQTVVVDPSAASFIACVRRHGRFNVQAANNNVLDGIRKVLDALRENRLFFSPGCKDTLREFSLYRWEDRPGVDRPVKEHDHAMDDLRYFVTTALRPSPAEDLFALSVPRHA